MLALEGQGRQVATGTRSQTSALDPGSSPADLAGDESCAGSFWHFLPCGQALRRNPGIPTGQTVRRMRTMRRMIVTTARVWILHNHVWKYNPDTGNDGNYPPHRPHRPHIMDARSRLNDHPDDCAVPGFPALLETHPADRRLPHGSQLGPDPGQTR